jgi:hypothetical protein
MSDRTEPALPIDPNDEQLEELWLSGPGESSHDWFRALFQAGVEAERARAAAETTEAAEALVRFERLMDQEGGAGLAKYAADELDLIRRALGVQP